MTISLVYLLVNKYWNKTAALISSLFITFFPVSILDDSFGLLEQLGVTFLLLGIYLINFSPILTGFIWAIASMVRAEAWIFGLLLLILAKRVIKGSGHYSMLLIGWLIPMVFYLKYLLDYTGNAIYPVWWNYLANIKGAWATKIIYTDYQLAVKPYLIGWFVVSILLFLFVWWKLKNKGSILILFMLSYWIFMAGVLGLTHYLTGFQPWFWFIRFFEYPYIFAIIFLSIFLFYYIPKKFKIFNHWSLTGLFIGFVFLILLLTQVGFWPPIMAKYNSTKPMWERTKMVASTIAKNYQDGTILIPEGDPNFTYALVYFNKIKANKLQGQMYDPFFYIKEDVFENWGENRKKILSWLKEDDIKLIVFYDDTEKYQKLIKKEPLYFEALEPIPEARLLIYRVFPDRITISNEE